MSFLNTDRTIRLIQALLLFYRLNPEASHPEAEERCLDLLEKLNMGRINEFKAAILVNALIAEVNASLEMCAPNEPPKRFDHLSLYTEPFIDLS